MLGLLGSRVELTPTMPNQTSKTDLNRTLDKVRRHQLILLDLAAGFSLKRRSLSACSTCACRRAAGPRAVDAREGAAIRSEKGDLLVIAGTGWKPGVVGHARLGADMLSPPGRAYQTRDCIAIGNIKDDPAFRYSPLLRDHGIVSLLNAPIAIEGVVWGVMELDSTEPNAFDEDDQHFLTAFAIILGLAVRHRQAQARSAMPRRWDDGLFRPTPTCASRTIARVRNYFQMILSILGSRSRRAANEQARTELDEVMDRVTAVELAHDLLTIESGQSVVDAATYLDALCLGFERTLGEELRIERDLEPILLRPDRAVPLGLVLNELVTNCIKYAVKDRASRTHRCHVSCRRRDQRGQACRA